MKRTAAVAVILLALAAAIPAPAARVGLIRVFAITRSQADTGVQHRVTKVVRDRRGRTIGHIGQVCTDLPGPHQLCTGTLTMPLGKIMFAGSRHNARYYVLAIVGGTGLYAGAGGTYVAHTVSEGPRVEWLLLSLVP